MCNIVIYVLIFMRQGLASATGGIFFLNLQAIVHNMVKSIFRKLLLLKKGKKLKIFQKVVCEKKVDTHLK